MVNLEAKIGFMLSKFRDLIIKAALDLIRRRHQDKCSFGSSMELNAKIIEKEPSKLESVNTENKISYSKSLSLKNFNSVYSSETSKTEVLVSCCCGQNFRLNNKDKEFQDELNRVQVITKSNSYEAKQQSTKEYGVDKKTYK